MSTLKTDSFDYANGALATVSGGVWANDSVLGALQVTGAAVSPNVSGDGSARLGAWTGSATMQWAQIKHAVFAQFNGPCVFHNGAGTFYFYDCRSDQNWIYKVVNGTFTGLATDATAGSGFATGDVARLEAESNGTTTVLLRGYKNGVLRLSVTDTAIPAGGRPGLRMWNGDLAARLDDFAAGDLQVLTFNASNATWPWSTIRATALRAYAIGGGGGGGAAIGNPCSGGGGKGGSYGTAVITKGAESTLAITVAAGGTAPSGDGTAGGVSSVVQGAATVVAGAGGGGGGQAVTNSSNGAGGTALNGTSVGATTFAGGDGATGAFASGSKSGGGGGAASTGGSGGAGASGATGTPGTGNGMNAGTGAAGSGNNLAGGVGGNYGGGGSGGKANTTTDQLGGAGAPGIVWFVYDDPPIVAPTGQPSVSSYVILPR